MADKTEQEGQANQTEQRDPTHTKEHYRKLGIVRRNAMSVEAARRQGAIIFSKVIQDTRYQAAGKVLVYLDYNGEVMTGDLILHSLEAGKRVYCPRVTEVSKSGEWELRFYELSGDFEKETELGYKGIREPLEILPQWQEAQDLADTLLMMPGVAFDHKRNRIGFGKGFYDRFLAQTGNIQTMALAFDCQVFEQIPCGDHDYRPDVLITPGRIY